MMGAETNIGTLWIALGGVVIAALTYIVTRAATRRKIIGKIDFMSDALDSGETAFRYSESRWRNRRLNKSLNRLRSIFEAEKADIRERERYFGTMLDHVQSGVIVIDGEKSIIRILWRKGFWGWRRSRRCGRSGGFLRTWQMLSARLLKWSRGHLSFRRGVRYSFP